MSLTETIAIELMQKYGDTYRLHFRQVSDELGITIRTAQNQLSRGLFPIPTFLLGRNRYCLMSEVAAYLAGLVEAGQHEYTTLQRRLGRIR